MRSEVDYKAMKQGYVVWGKDTDGVDFEVWCLFYPAPWGHPDIPTYWNIRETRNIILLGKE